MNRNITATILLVLAIGIYFTVTQGVLDSARAIQTVNAQYLSAMDSADQLIKGRDQVLKNYNNLSQEDRARLDKMIPNTVDNIRLIIDLNNNVALRHGFSLKNIKAVASQNNQNGNAVQAQPAPSVPMNSVSNASVGSIPTPVLDTVTVSFSVTAPYQQFRSFMQDLEADLRIMDLTHLTLSVNDTGTYDYSVELKTYWMRSQ